MLSGVLAHVIASILASSSGLLALAWVFIRHDDPYGDLIMAGGRAAAWASILYLLIGFVLYGAAFRSRSIARLQPERHSRWTGWLMQVAGAGFALAASAFVAASARRGPGGDFRALGYILLGFAIVGILAGICMQGWLWKAARDQAKALPPGE